MNPRHRLASYGARRVGMEFALWAAKRHRFPNYAEVMDEFDVSEATAQRWLNDYADATGLARSLQRGHYRFAVPA